MFLQSLQILEVRLFSTGKKVPRLPSGPSQSLQLLGAALERLAYFI